MLVELSLLFIICVSGTIFFTVIFEELGRYKKVLKIQAIFNNINEETIYTPKEGKAKLNIFSKLEEKMLLANFKFLPCYFNIATLLFSLILGKLYSLYFQTNYGFIVGLINGIFVAYLFLETIIKKRKKVLIKHWQSLSLC